MLPSISVLRHPYAPFCATELQKLVASCKKLDGISNIALKLTITSNAEHILDIYNACMSENVFLY